MKRAMTGTVVTLAAMSVAGLAHATGSQAHGGVLTPAAQTIVAQATQPSTPSTPAEKGAIGGAPSAAQPAVPPPTIIGKDLVDSKGKKVGKVAKIDGDQVVVAVGGFLGIGARDVAVPWKSLTTIGSGGSQKVETSMTEDELKQLPEYKTSENGSGIRAMPPRSGGMGGPTSSPTR